MHIDGADEVPAELECCRQSPSAQAEPSPTQPTLGRRLGGG